MEDSVSIARGGWGHILRCSLLTAKTRWLGIETPNEVTRFVARFEALGAELSVCVVMGTESLYYDALSCLLPVFQQELLGCCALWSLTLSVSSRPLQHCVIHGMHGYLVIIGVSRLQTHAEQQYSAKLTSAQLVCYKIPIHSEMLWISGMWGWISGKSVCWVVHESFISLALGTALKQNSCSCSVLVGSCLAVRPPGEHHWILMGSTVLKWTLVCH